MNADRHDQQHQHAGFRQWLECQTVGHRTQRHHQNQRQNDLCQQGQLSRFKGKDQPGSKRRIQQIPADDARNPALLSSPDGGDQINHRNRDTDPDQQPQRAGYLASLKAGQRQGTIGNKLSLWNEDYPSDGKHQHQRQRKQRIDCAIGNSILTQQQRNLQIHVSAFCLAIPDWLQQPYFGRTANLLLAGVTCLPRRDLAFALLFR
jgi:hypothetical protein